MFKKKWVLPITITMFLLGLLLSNQLQIKNQLDSDLSLQKSEDLIAMVKNLKEKRDSLDKEVYSLETEMQEIKYAGPETGKTIENLRSEKRRLQIINGSTALTGPGIRVIIEEDSPILYVDIIQIVNELWGAGAEAISINEHRITFNTAIFYSEKDFNTFVTVDDTLLSFPLEIKALGNSETLDKGLTLPGGIIDNLALFQAYPEIVQEDSLTVPATKQKPTISKLKEVKEKD